MNSRLKFALVGLWAVVAIVHTPCDATAEEISGRELLTSSKRVMFLGDSITASGQYIGYFDAWLVTELKDKAPRLIDCGLPSETVSGLSEVGHAGGQFPRPDLAERLDRVLTAVKPDLVIACYGINCGIYLPFEESRLNAYKWGMMSLKTAVTRSGAQFVVMTPPFYDDQRAPRNFTYNTVLDRYSDWLVSQRKEGWTVIDVHSPMTKFIQAQRQDDPQFTVQPDGVHPNEAGHWLVAQQLIRWAGDDKSAAMASPQGMLKAKGIPESLLALSSARVGVLRDAYVGAAGHKRPGVAKGLPVDQAEAKADELSAKIAAVLSEMK
ncbi:MAG: family lipolytic protein [Schlesneria sp.]|nr:family lipolytic protein [Schlesneria sp.]